VAFNKYSLMILTFLISTQLFAAPIDWKGTLAFDTNIIKDFRRTGETCTVANGSECIKDEESNARYQSMILKLNPSIIVNDAVTIKGELSTGNVRTSLMGASTSLDTNSDGTNNDTKSPFAQNTGSNLTVNQFYANLIADTALYRIGRFSKHYGLGALINSGDKVSDRFFSGYEGIEAKLSLGNFKLTPMWAKVHTSDNPNGRFDSTETSIDALYDDANKNFKFGLYYGQREVESNSTLSAGAGSQSITIIDVFFSKEWDSFKFGLEIPMLSGEINNLYGTTDADFDSNAYILESEYKLNTKWNLGLNAGMVKGDDGSTGSFEGMYLHPNYQLAKVMFKHNYHGFNDATKYDAFNSSIVNTTYAQLFAHYTSGEWSWKLSALWAKANEVASKGSDFYDHTTNKVVLNANADQSDDLGYELDIAFDYQWNPTVMFSGHVGYHFVGDYYAFQNSATDELDLSNVMSTGMQLAINF
jgi:hypothetical protein